MTTSIEAADFCMYSLHTTGWEYDLYNACGEIPIRVFSTTERKHCKRCGRKMMFVPEAVEPSALRACEATMANRAEAAEAEVVRLRSLLEGIVRDDWQWIDGVKTLNEFAKRAAKALEAKP